MAEDSDIFSDLLAAAAERLNADDWFVEAGLHVIPEDHGDLVTEMQKGLTRGMLLVLSIGEVMPQENGVSVAVELRLTASEDTILNRSQTGSQQPAQRVLARAWASMLDQDWTAGEIWAPCTFGGLTAPEIDAENKLVNMGLTVRTATTPMIST